jgi:TRAP-type mannitol/chloroaromatic compound transport system permease small subunit
MTQATVFPGVLSRLLALAGSLSSAAVWAGGLLTLASTLLISGDVIVRKLFGVTVGGADELSGYAFAISTTWALAFAALNRANVRIDALYLTLPTRLAAFLDWLALVSLGLFIALLSRYAFDVVALSWSRGARANTPLGTPLWMPQLLWFAGLAWMCLVLALMLIRASWALVTGDLQALGALCGVRTAQQEADEEAAAGERLILGERA